VVCFIGINYGGKIEKIIRRVNIGKLLGTEVKAEKIHLKKGVL